MATCANSTITPAVQAGLLPRRDARGRFGMVDFRAVKPLPEPVELATVKAEPKLKDMVLGNNSRLSVQPVTDAEWELVCKMGGL